MIARSLILIFLSVCCISCGEESLQKYLVKKQDDPKFLKVDLSPKLLEGKNNALSEDSKEALKNIKKINVVAYPLKDNPKEEFNSERAKIESILSQERYMELTRIKNPEWNVEISYTGSESVIDELVVYAQSEQHGFAVFRLLADHLKPEEIAPIIQVAAKGEFDFSGISELRNLFETPLDSL